MHRAFPACRHADGTISSSTVMDVRRMASEDSDQLSSGFLSVHRLSDLRDIGDPLDCEVMTGVDQLNAARELLEVALLRCSQRVVTKERNDRLDQIRPTPHHEAKQVLPVIVVALVAKHLTNPKERLELVQAGHALRALRHDKLMTYLVPSSAAGPAQSATLAHETNREASFSVYKTNNPAESNQPFLLIFRTAQIVTVHNRSLGRVPDGYTGFPAYSRIHSALLPVRWATI